MTTKKLIEHLQRYNPDAEVTIHISGYMGRAREDADEELQASRAPALGGQLVLCACDIKADEYGVAIQVCHRIIFDIGSTLSISGDVCRL